MSMTSNYKRLMEEKLQYEEEQKNLHEKHKDIDENKVIVEKSNTVKFLIKAITAFIKTVAVIILILLATTGLITLMYDNLRADFFQILMDTMNSLKS